MIEGNRKESIERCMFRPDPSGFPEELIKKNTREEEGVWTHFHKFGHCHNSSPKDLNTETV